MKTLPLIAATLAALLAGCSSKSASKSTFEHAINAHFAKHCLQLDPSTSDANEISEYPARLTFVTSDDPAGAAQMNREITGSFDALTKAGLMTEQDANDGFFGGATKHYTLTPFGEKALYHYGNQETTRFCAGRLKVEEIVNYSEPAVANGMTMSRVTYTTRALDVPDWAMSKDITDTIPAFVTARTTGAKWQLTLVLMNDGWIVDGDQTL